MGIMCQAPQGEFIEPSAESVYAICGALLLNRNFVPYCHLAKQRSPECPAEVCVKSLKRKRHISFSPF